MKSIVESDNQSNFDARCYALLRLIPQGKVTTYKEIARALDSRAWRAVGTAMAKNKQLITTPCHRVVRSDGSIGGYAKGQAEKQRLLVKEGIEIINTKIMNMPEVMFYFDDHDEKADDVFL